MNKQLKWIFGVLFLTLSAQIVFLETAFSQRSCAEYFEKSISGRVLFQTDSSYFLEETESHFKQSKNLIFESTNKAPSVDKSGEFYFSNEIDFFRAPIDRSEAEVMVGFANNNVWDLAVRKNVKKMVLVDWSIRPLMVQEYLMRPLVLIARTPAEFLSFMSLEPSAASTYLSLQYTFGHIRHASSNQTLWKQNAISYAAEILQRISMDSRFSVTHLAMVSEFFKFKIYGKPMSGPFANDYSSKRFKRAYEAIENRYNPEVLMLKGANPKVVEDPFFSFLSSPESYRRLQRLFDGNVFYARTEYESPHFYQKVAQIFGAESYAVSISNIIDVMYDVLNQPSLATAALRSYLRVLQNNLVSRSDQNITFFQTRGAFYAHSYQREVLAANTDIESIRRISSPDEALMRSIEERKEKPSLADWFNELRKEALRTQLPQ